MKILSFISDCFKELKKDVLSFFKKEQKLPSYKEVLDSFIAEKEKNLNDAGEEAKLSVHSFLMKKAESSSNYTYIKFKWDFLSSQWEYCIEIIPYRGTYFCEIFSSEVKKTVKKEVNSKKTVINSKKRNTNTLKKGK